MDQRVFEVVMNSNYTTMWVFLRNKKVQKLAYVIFVLLLCRELSTILS